MSARAAFALGNTFSAVWVCANAPTGSADGPDGEVMLDIEVVGAIAPAAKIVVYFAPNTDAGFLDAITTAVHDTTHRPSVVSIADGDTLTGLGLTGQEQADLQTAVDLDPAVDHPGFARRLTDIVTENPDAAGLDSEQPRHKREQSAFSGAVQAEQSGEARGCHGEIDIDQRTSRAIGMADGRDRQRRSRRRVAPDRFVRKRGGDCARWVGYCHGDIVTPHGSSPT